MTASSKRPSQESRANLHGDVTQSSPSTQSLQSTQSSSRQPSQSRPSAETSRNTANTPASWLIKPQPRLGTAGLTVLLIAANAVVPFSLDIYTPAVPQMPALFHTTQSLVNLTIIGFFFFFAIGQLVFGPISDRSGRKPVLLGCCIAYALGSIACAVSPVIGVLIVARVIQALGAGGILAVSTALVKDCYDARRREAILAFIQIMSVIGPVAAPLLGGFIIRYSSWRMAFWFLACLGILCTVAAALFEESLPVDERVERSMIQTLSGLPGTLTSKPFRTTLLTVSMFSAAFMAYIEVASYIYVDTFHRTPQEYSWFLAATAAVSVLGPLSHALWFKKIPYITLTWLLIGVSGIAGVLLLVFGESCVWMFFLPMVVFATAEATIRPYTTSMMLGFDAGDTGSVSSMINFANTAFGCLGMGLVMLFGDHVHGVTALLLLSMAVAAVSWYRACRALR